MRRLASLFVVRRLILDSLAFPIREKMIRAKIANELLASCGMAPPDAVRKLPDKILAVRVSEEELPLLNMQLKTMGFESLFELAHSLAKALLQSEKLVEPLARAVALNERHLLYKKDETPSKEVMLAIVQEGSGASGGI